MVSTYPLCRPSVGGQGRGENGVLRGAFQRTIERGAKGTYPEDLVTRDLFLPSSPTFGRGVVIDETKAVDDHLVLR